MLNAYAEAIDDLLICCAHAGRKAEAGNRIYALSAVRLDQNGLIRRFESLLRYSHFTAREHHRSGVTREAVAGAPEPEAVFGKLGDFLAGTDPVMVMGFDDAPCRLTPHLPGRRVVDLRFAAGFFLPHLRAYTFGHLHQFLHDASWPRIGYAARDGVDLGRALVRHICGSVLCTDHSPYAPVLRHFLQQSDTLFGRLFLHVLETFPAYFGGVIDPGGARTTDHWWPFLEARRRSLEPGEPPEICRPVSEEAVQELFAGLARSGDGFSLRPAQVTYATHVARALNTGAVMTLEAGTGIGKTQGYLIPAMEFLRQNPGAQVVISTYTKNLQEQIFQKEIAVTRKLLPDGHAIRAALLKGKSSYLCAQQLADLHDEQMTGKALIAWLYCLILTFQFRRADRDTISSVVVQHLGPRLARMLREASAGTGCHPGHRRCPAQIVTAEALEADLVITNHHKLALADRDPLLSGRFTNCIIDEANHFEQAVRSAFGSSVSSKEVQGILHYMAGRYERLASTAADAASPRVADALAGIDALQDRLTRFRKILSEALPDAPYGQPQIVAGDHPLVADPDFLESMGEMAAGLREIAGAVTVLQDAEIWSGVKGMRKTTRRMEAGADQLMEYAGVLTGIAQSILDDNHITACQLFKQNWTLSAQWVAVGDLIRRHFYERKERIVFTAATLTHRGSFGAFARLAGMADGDDPGGGEAESRFRFAAIPSPYAADAMEIVVPDGAVSGKYGNKAAWLAQVSELLPDLIAENRGRTLVLFASYDDLTAVLRRVRRAIDESRYPLLVQRPGEGTAMLCEEFRSIRESVLFGVDTFWYGVDFKGETLTQVVITRIPYPNPGDPIQVARRKTLPGDQYWRRYQYDTEIKMRQGMGRLIRGPKDRGRVVILDRRYRG